MSESSLPEIFKRSFTTPIRAEKVGGSFSLYLNSYSTEKYIPSRAGYAPNQNQYASVTTSRGKSVSLHQSKHKQSILKEINAKKVDGNKSKIRVSFRQESSFGNTTALKQKIGLSVMNGSNFPYETSRRFNNSACELQEVENIKNILGNVSRQVQIAQNCLGQIRNLTNETKYTLNRFCQDLSSDIGDFSSRFQESLKKCYSHLSSFRRETNEQLKSNKLNLSKLEGQIIICSSFSMDLLNKSENLYKQCVRTSGTSGSGRESSKGNDINIDFQELSSIKKSSRGATGDLSKRTRPIDLMKDSICKRKSVDLNLSTDRQTNNKFILNGKEIEMLKFQDQY